jgi:hypothetical protein
VQALRYEDYDSLMGQSSTGLKEFLFEFAMSSTRNFNQIHWSLKLEAENE